LRLTRAGAGRSGPTAQPQTPNRKCRPSEVQWELRDLRTSPLIDRPCTSVSAWSLLQSDSSWLTDEHFSVICHELQVRLDLPAETSDILIIGPLDVELFLVRPWMLSIGPLVSAVLFVVNNTSTGCEGSHWTVLAAVEDGFHRNRCLPHRGPLFYSRPIPGRLGDAFPRAPHEAGSALRRIPEPSGGSGGAGARPKWGFLGGSQEPPF
jgi:hypothetical protein